MVLFDIFVCNINMKICHIFNLILICPGCAYFIPCDADHVLRFHFDTETYDKLGVGDLPKGGDKWQGM